MRQWVTRVVTVGSTAEWMAYLDETTLPFEPLQDPIVLDRSRNVHPAPPGNLANAGPLHFDGNPDGTNRASARRLQSFRGIAGTVGV